MMNIYTRRFHSLQSKFAFTFLVMLCSLLVNSQAVAQRVYANQVTIGTAASDHVDNPSNALSSSETTFAQLNSYGGVLLNVGRFNGQLELKFPTTLQAGVTSYVRINSDPDLLKALLGGSLGNLLANVLGTVVLGNHFFTVEARNGSTAVLSGTSTNGFATNELRLIQDVNGYFYLALTPTQAYDRIYIRDETNAVLLGASNNTKVYYAFYNSSVSSDPCVQGFATSYEGTGLNLDALRLGGAGVTDAQNVIDSDTSNFSQLALGALAVAGSISQDIYFENLSVANDEFHIKLQSSPALLNVGLANNITVTTYNGATQVSSQPLSSLLSLDLLGLLNNGQRTTVVVRPGLPVNRIRITFSSLLNANLTQAIRFYTALRTAGRPTFTGAQAASYTVCTGGTVALNATTTTGNELRWYADSTTANTLFTTSSGAAYNPGPLNTATTYFVAAAKIGCPYESERVRVTVNVVTIPTDPIVPAVQPICTGRTATFAVSNPGSGVTYNWYAAATGGTSLGSGVSFITPALTDSATFYVEGTNGTCTNTGGRTAVLVPVTKLPAAVVPTPLTRQICAGNTTSFAVQNPIAGITYNWYDAPTGGTLIYTGENFVTPQLAANTSYYVEGVNTTGCTSPTRTQVSVTVNPLPATPVLNNAVATINPGGTATFTVSNPDATVTYNWYATSTGGTVITSGSSFTTPVLNNTTNYYVEAVGANGCPSSARATATVNVQNEIACGYATQQQTINTGGVCLLCNVADGANVVDNNYTNFSLITTAVGVGGYGQLLRFGNTYLPGDSISLVLEIPGQLVTAQLLGGIAVQTYSGNNPNGDLTTITPAVRLQLLGGGTNKFRITLPSTVSFDGVAVTLAGVSALAQLRVYSAQAFAPSPVLAPASVLVRASTQVSPVNTGVLCALCGVTNPLLAVDADTTTYSTISATLGLLGGVGQLVQFPGSYNAGDSVQFDLEIPGQVLGAQVLAGIQLETYTNNTANGNAVQATNPLVQLQLLGLGANKFRLKFAANHSFNGILISINGAAAVISNLRVYDAAVFYSSQNLVNICVGSSAVLTVSKPENATINWYTTASGGTPIFTGPTYTTPPVTVNTTYYIEAVRFGCANPNRTVVNVVPNAIPDNPTLNVNAVSICQGDSAKLWATAPAGKLFKWYTVSNGGTPVYTGDTLRTGPLTATTTYYVEALNNGCASNGRSQVTVTVNSAPADVTVVPPSATIGVGQTASFTASSATANTTFNWYTVQTGGTPVFTGPAFVTPALNASATYYLQAVSSGSCSNATRIAVPVTVITGAGTPVPCDAATAQTSTVNGLCIGCSVDAPALAVDGDATTSSSLRTTAGLLNAYVQQTLQFPFTADAGDTVAVHVTAPVGLADISLLSTVQLASYNGAVFNNDRTTVTNGGLIGLQLLTPTEAVLKFAPTQAFDRVEVRVNSGAATLLSTLSILYAQRIKASPVVTAVSQTLCQGSPATLQATGNANTTFRWYTTATGGTPVFTGPTFATGVLTDTITYYAEAVSSTGCAALLRTPFMVNVIEAPAAPALTNNPTTICAGTPATLTVQSPQAGVNYSWYATATGGTALATGNSYTTVALTRDSVFYVEAAIAGAGCTSGTRTAATIVVNAAIPAPAVISDSVAICSGTTATLNVQSPQSGVTYNWYNVATGGTPVGTGASFTTPAATADAEYFVEVVSGTNCVSPRTRVKVTAAQAPATPTFTVNPVSAAVQPGGTATIQASSTTSNVVFNWYLQSSGGTPVFTGASFTTPGLTATTTYYLEAVSATGCASTRAAVTITVNPGVNLDCDAATSETNSASGICAGCGVSTPGGAVDTDTTTFSSLNLAVSLLGGNVEQTLRFGSVIPAGDTVVISMEGPASLLAADILGAIRVTSFNGATSNNDTRVLNDAAVKIQLLGAGAPGKFIARFVPAASFDAVQVQLNGGLVSALNSLNIYYATRKVATPVITTTQPVTICSGGSATLQASASVNATIDWFTVPTGGTSVNTGSSYTVGPLTATTTYYVQAKRVTGSVECVNNTRAQVTVIVNPVPDAPAVVSNAVSICAGQTAVLQVSNPQSGFTYNWYNASGAAAGSGVSFTTPALNASTSYSVEAVNSNSCASGSKTTVNVTVNTIPAARGIANDGAAICSGAATLSIDAPEANVTYNWYNVATGGSIIFSGTTYTTPVLTATTKYYIEAVSASGCSTGTRTEATVNVNPTLPPPQVVSNNVSVCAGNAATFSVLNPQAALTYNWYTTATGGAAVFTGADYTIATATANATYYVEAAGAGSCASSTRTVVTLTVTPQPAAPVLVTNSQSVCAGAQATFSVQTPASGVTYRWFDAATGGTLLFTGTSFTTTALNTTTSFYVEGVTGTGCTSSARTSATVTVNPIPVIPVITGGNVSVCSGTSVTLAVQNPQTGVTYNWYTASTGGTLAYTGVSFPTPALTASTTYYVEAVGTGGCSATVRAIASVTVNATPAAPVIAGGSGNVCSGTAVTLTVVTPEPGATYSWYDASTAGTLLFTGTSITTAPLTANATYYVQASNGSCSNSNRTQVTITVSTRPDNPVIAANGTTVCLGQSTTLSVENPQTSFTYRWFTSGSGGTQLATGSSYTTPALNGNATYYVEVSNGTCTSSMRTAVDVTTVAQPPAPVIAATGTTICAGNATTLSIQNPMTGYTYNWYDASGGGNLLNTGTTYTTNVLNANTTFYVSTALNTGCSSSSRTAATVTVNAAPAVPTLVTASQTICSGDPVTMQVQNPASGATYNWYTVATNGTSVFTGTTYTVNSVTANTVYYVEVVSATGCRSLTRASATVNVLAAPPAPSVANATPSVCSGSAITLTATSTVTGAVFNWYTTATSTTVIATGSSFTAGPITSDTSFYVAVVNTTGCRSAARTQVTVTLLRPLAAPVVTVDNTTSQSVTFKWDAVAGATGYQVTQDGGTSYVVPNGGNGLTHTIGGLQPNQQGSIQVRALGAQACQNSPLSAVTTGTASNPLGNSIFIPNVFTPNNDGRNDFFIVYGNNIKDAEMWIYSQWGDQLFQTKDRTGWNGMVGGKLQPVGVYIYVVKVTLQDGTVIDRKGAVNLVR